jgi:hypothetical protein
VQSWAREVLADPLTVVFDTETTRLYGAIVEASVVDRDRRVVFSSRVDPREPIWPDATAVHGIRDQDVAGVADPFAVVWPRLREALEGRRIIAYNMPYDRSVLASELHRMHRAADRGPARRRARSYWSAVLRAVARAGSMPWPAATRGSVARQAAAQAVHPAAAQWVDGQAWECAMLPFAEWTGVPSSSPERRWRNQRLPGGDHTSAGDCRAVWDLLERLAQG